MKNFRIQNLLRSKSGPQAENQRSVLIDPPSAGTRLRFLSVLGWPVQDPVFRVKLELGSVCLWMRRACRARFASSCLSLAGRSQLVWSGLTGSVFS